jgi:hypothetical protein
MAQMCVWCEENPVAEGDVICAPCKRDEEEAAQGIQENPQNYDSVISPDTVIEENFDLGDDELPF